MGKQSDSLKTIKKADRELELELNGGRWKAITTIHQSKKKYKRNKQYNYE